MKILAFHNVHDSQLSAIENGEIKLHLEFERHFNIKHFNNWKTTKRRRARGRRRAALKYGNKDVLPEMIDLALDQLGWSDNEIDFLAFTTILHPSGANSFTGSVFEDVVDKACPKDQPYMRWKSKWRGKERQCVGVIHHVAHLGLAYYTSPFNDALVLAIDGCGEYNINTMSGVGENESITQHETHRDNSIGLVYSSCGRLFRFLGTDMLAAAGKAMGLSSYGEPVDKWRKAVKKRIGWSGSRKHLRFQVASIRAELGLSKKELNDPNSAIARDLMATIQDEAELYMIKKVGALVKKHGKRNLCLAGGCALNVQINTRLLKDGIIDGFYAPPACSDTGLSSGAGLYLWHNILKNEFGGMSWHNPYLGMEIRNKEILLQKHKDLEIIEFPNTESLVKETAKRLKDNQIAAWSQGRSEIGPRALGNRSILANPQKAEMKDIINERIKHREYWRPFAPICLEEDIEEWFEIDHPQPYMLESPMTKEDKKDLIPSVVHVDGTARLQSVNVRQNSLLHSLISEFKEITGIPILLNTSLNDKGFPICNDVETILNLLRDTKLDFAVIDNYMIS